MVKQNFSSWALFITLAIVWGSSFILMKDAALSLTGWQIGSIRITAAGIVLLPLAIFHIRKIPLRKLPLVILSGTLGNLFPAFLFAIAIDKKINSSLAGILNSLTPLFVVLVGLLFFGMKVHQKKIIGVVIGFIGLVLLTLTRRTVTIDNYGFTLLTPIATVLYGFNVNLVGRYLKEINPLMIATVSMVFIAIPAATEEEAKHDFLWRIHHHAPARGMIQIFNRSHYEDVLVTRVHGWCDDAMAQKRFDAINNFEEMLTLHNDTIIFKFYLHISPEEQQERLKERMDDPTKQWKYNKKDFEEAGKWEQYMDMYEDIFENCAVIPWTIVPADQNWYKEHLIAKTLVEKLRELNMKYPQLNSKEE